MKYKAKRIGIRRYLYRGYEIKGFYYSPKVAYVGKLMMRMDVDLLIPIH